MAQTLRLAVSQSHTLSTTAATLAALEATAVDASRKSIDLVLFPEAYLGGYPRTATFGTSIGARHPEGREQFLRYFKDAIDLGDTPEGGGQLWVERALERPRDGVRGDGTREELERIARETGVFVVVGLIERSGGTLYCSVLYICPKLGVLGKRRKVMPTGSERLIWGQGQPSSLRAVTTVIKGVKLTLAAAICWESYMPLLRQSLYSQNVNLYLAPTADGRDTWLPLMRTIAGEGRCVVLSSNQCLREADLPEWVTGEKQKASTPAPASHTNGGAQSPPRSRRKSLLTQEGHEIILPVIQSGDEADSRPEEATNSPNGYSRSPLGLRRKSITITEDGHEIALPEVQGGEEGSTRQRTSRLNGHTKSPPRFRRKSTTVTDEGHEIVLPEIKEASDNFNLSHQQSQPRSADFLSRGGSCIISPFGDVLAGPLYDDDNGLLAVDVDFDDCLRGRLDIDVGGSYSRNDAFRLSVEGLDLTPPP